MTVMRTRKGAGSQRGGRGFEFWIGPDDARQQQDDGDRQLHLHDPDSDQRQAPDERDAGKPNGVCDGLKGSGWGECHKPSERARDVPREHWDKEQDNDHASREGSTQAGHVEAQRQCQRERHDGADQRHRDGPQEHGLELGVMDESRVLVQRPGALDEHDGIKGMEGLRDEGDNAPNQQRE